METKHLVVIKTTKCNQTAKTPGKNENFSICLYFKNRENAKTQGKKTSRG
jgi:hypothetical protein